MNISQCISPLKRSIRRQSSLIQPAFEVVLYLLVLLLSLYFLFSYQYTFNYETDENGQYLGSMLVFVIFFVFLLLHLLLGISISGLQKGLIGLDFILMLYLCFSNRFSFYNEYFANLCIVIIVCTMLLSANITLLRSIIATFLVIYFIQIGLAFKQMKGFSFQINMINIKGSFPNSGVFCCYLVSQLPFAVFNK